MPKAGIEPARGLAPLDFESSASPSSATSARRRHRIRLSGLEGMPRRSHNARFPTEASSSAEPGRLTVGIAVKAPARGERSEIRPTEEDQ